MSIYYFFIGSKETNTSIVSIVETSLGGNIQQFNEIKLKGDNYFSSITEKETQNIDNEIPNFKAYYTLTKDNYFYYIVVPNEYSENLNIEIIFNLIKEVNDNGIPKQVDSNGTLTSSGNQNLKLIIQKYTEKKNTESNETNHEKLETIDDIIKDSQRQDVVALGKGGEKENINANKKEGHMELKEEVSLDDINKNQKPLEIAQNENEHPYQRMHEIIKKKIRLTKIIVYSISGSIAFAILIRIMAYGKYFSE